MSDLITISRLLEKEQERCAALEAERNQMLSALKEIDAALADRQPATRKGYLTRAVKMVREAIAMTDGKEDA